MTPRRRFLYLAAGAVALLAASRIAWAQAYPTRPVRIIAPRPPSAAIVPLHQESWHPDRIFRPPGVPFLKQGPLPDVIFGKRSIPLGRKRFGSPTGSGNVLV
jgi:hypothetical protein